MSGPAPFKCTRGVPRILTRCMPLAASLSTPSSTSARPTYDPPASSRRRTSLSPRGPSESAEESGWRGVEASLSFFADFVQLIQLAISSRQSTPSRTRLRQRHRLQLSLRKTIPWKDDQVKKGSSFPGEMKKKGFALKSRMVSPSPNPDPCLKVMANGPRHRAQKQGPASCSSKGRFSSHLEWRVRTHLPWQLSIANSGGVSGQDHRSNFVSSHLELS